MAGAWINFVRSPYKRLFTEPVAQQRQEIVMPPTPPPVSPIVPLARKEIVRHAYDDEEDENLSDVDIDVDAELVPIEGCRDETPPDVQLKKLERKARTRTEYIIECKRIRTQKVNLLKNAGFKCKMAKFGFVSENGIAVLTDHLSKCASPVIFDATQSLALSLIISQTIKPASITIQAVAGMQQNVALMNVIKENVQQVSVRFDPLTEFDLIAASNYTHIIADFANSDAADILALLRAFSSSPSTGVIYASSLKQTIIECRNSFPTLVFNAVPTPYNRNPELLSMKHRTLFIAIYHRQGEHPVAACTSHMQIVVGRKGRPRKRTSPVTSPVSSPEYTKTLSPLHHDFSFEHMNSISNELSPRIPTPVVVETPTVPETTTDDIQSNDSSSVIVEEQQSSNSSTDVVEEQERPAEVAEESAVENVQEEHSSATEVQESPEKVADDVQEEVVVQSERTDDVPIIVLDDEDEIEEVDPLRAKIDAMTKRISQKVSLFRQYRSLVPVDSSPEFGGTCPLTTDKCLSIIAERMCTWMHNEEGPHSFLDIRSKSTTGILLSTLFRNVKFGHVVYSRQYDSAIYDMHRMFRWPLSFVATTLDGLRSDHLHGYSMLFASASCLGNRDHRQLECILDAFHYSTDSRVLWLQMTKPQAAHAIEHFGNLDFKLICEKFPNKSNDPFYEIRK